MAPSNRRDDLAVAGVSSDGSSNQVESNGTDLIVSATSRPELPFAGDEAGKVFIATSAVVLCVELHRCSCSVSSALRLMIFSFLSQFLKGLNLIIVMQSKVI